MMVFAKGVLPHPKGFCETKRGFGPSQGFCPIAAMGDTWKGVAIHKSNQIYVSNLPEGTTEQMVTDLFGQVGQVAKDPKQTRFNPNAKKVYLYKDKRSGRMKGDGTVTFNDEDTAAVAVEFFHNTEFILGDHPLIFGARGPNYCIGRTWQQSTLGPLVWRRRFSSRTALY